MKTINERLINMFDEIVGNTEITDDIVTPYIRQNQWYWSHFIEKAVKESFYGSDVMLINNHCINNEYHWSNHVDCIEVTPTIIVNYSKLYSVRKINICKRWHGRYDVRWLNEYDWIHTDYAEFAGETQHYMRKRGRKHRPYSSLIDNVIDAAFDRLFDIDTLPNDWVHVKRLLRYFNDVADMAITKEKGCFNGDSIHRDIEFTKEGIRIAYRAYDSNESLGEMIIREDDAPIVVSIA